MLRLARYGVVVVWVALLVVLARSQLPTATPPPATTPMPLGAGQATSQDEWSGLYMKGHKVGYAHTHIEPRGDGYRLDETSVMRLTVLDREQNVRAVIGADAGPDWAVRRFTVSLITDLGDFDVRGTVDAKTLVIAMDSGGETTEQRLPLSEPVYLPSSARAALQAQGLKAGASTTLRVFDPSALAQEPMTITVVGRDTLTIDGVAVAAWKLHESFRGIESQVWLDEDGHTLREEGPMGLVTMRENADNAVNNGWDGAPFDLMGAVAIPVREPLADPRHLAHLRAQLSGIDGIAVPSDARQALRDGTLTVAREANVAATYELPYSGEARRADLQATPFLQIDHPSVQAAAREALGDEREPRRAADRLRRWVYDNLEKRPVASIPNAVQVLQLRAGDCNEHAVLFAALARAVGLPSRIVAGLVYADGAFLYHAWDEVWLGNGWLTVDAAFDQMPVDATHIKLIEGGPEMHAGLVPIIGRLSIDLLPPDSPG
ncbi:MAG: transglutaminase domain-containing protein [bacterium]